MSSPHLHGEGFTGAKPSSLRYGNAKAIDEHEVPGIIRRPLPNNAHVLDIGAGTGPTALAINQGKSNTLICVEPDHDRATAARQRGLVVVEKLFDRDVAAELR